MGFLRVASRYAKALVSLAVEQNVLDAVKADADFVLDTINSSKELRVLFASPVVKPDVKQRIICRHLWIESERDDNAVYDIVNPPQKRAQYC